MFSPTVYQEIAEASRDNLHGLSKFIGTILNRGDSFEQMVSMPSEPVQEKGEHKQADSLGTFQGRGPESSESKDDDDLQEQVEKIRDEYYCAHRQWCSRKRIEAILSFMRGERRIDAILSFMRDKKNLPVGIGKRKGDLICFQKWEVIDLIDNWFCNKSLETSSQDRALIRQAFIACGGSAPPYASEWSIEADSRSHRDN